MSQEAVWSIKAYLETRREKPFERRRHEKYRSESP